MIDKLKNSTCLVTGGAGFIGSNLVDKLLENNIKVIVLDNLSNGNIENIKQHLNNVNFTFVEGDIRDYDTCLLASKDVDYIFHQAALGSVPRSIKEPRLYEKVNVLGTLNIFEAARQNKVKRVVYASSSSVYGSSEKLPKVEGDEGEVLSPYALSKKLNEEYGRLYYDLYNVETIGLRYFNVFGKRQNPNGEYAAVIPKWINSLKNDQRPVIYGDGLQSRDFTYIDNVISANILAATSEVATFGKAYNIAGHSQVTLNELLSVLNKILGKDIKPIFESERTGDIKHSFASVENAFKAFNYQVKVNFESGLKETIKWY